MRTFLRSRRGRQTLRRNLIYSSCESFLSSTMVGAGETFLPAFALALGASSSTAGMLAALPFLIGSTLQLAAPQILSRVGCYRKAVAGLALLQSLSFGPFVWFSMRGQVVPIWMFTLMVTLYWASGLSGGTAWASWMTEVVPEKIRSRYFAKRNHMGQIGLIVGLLAGGTLLEVAKRGGWTLKAFAGLFLLSLLTRLLSSVCLVRQSPCEVKQETCSPNRESLAQVFFGIRETTGKLFMGSAGALFKFLFVFTIAVYVSSWFFNPFIIKRLGYSYQAYMWLTAAAYLAKMVVFSMLSKQGRERDPFRLMYFGLIGAALTPAAWLLSANFIYLLSIQVVSGAFWALYELGLVLVLFRAVKDEERTRVVSVFNFVSAIMVLIGTACGALLLSQFGDDVKSYQLVFALSAASRVACLILFERAVTLLKGRFSFAMPSLAYEMLRSQRVKSVVRVPLRVTEVTKFKFLFEEKQ